MNDPVERDKPNAKDIKELLDQLRDEEGVAKDKSQGPSAAELAQRAKEKATQAAKEEEERQQQQAAEAEAKKAEEEKRKNVTIRKETKGLKLFGDNEEKPYHTVEVATKNASAKLTFIEVPNEEDPSKPGKLWVAYLKEGNQVFLEVNTNRPPEKAKRRGCDIESTFLDLGDGRVFDTVARQVCMRSELVTEATAVEPTEEFEEADVVDFATQTAEGIDETIEEITETAKGRAQFEYSKEGTNEKDLEFHDLAYVDTGHGEYTWKITLAAPEATGNIPAATVEQDGKVVAIRPIAEDSEKVYAQATMVESQRKPTNELRETPQSAEQLRTEQQPQPPEIPTDPNSEHTEQAIPMLVAVTHNKTESDLDPRRQITTHEVIMPDEELSFSVIEEANGDLLLANEERPRPLVLVRDHRGLPVFVQDSLTGDTAVAAYLNKERTQTGYYDPFLQKLIIPDSTKPESGSATYFKPEGDNTGEAGQITLSLRPVELAAPNHEATVTTLVDKFAEQVNEKLVLARREESNNLTKQPESLIETINKSKKRKRVYDEEMQAAIDKAKQETFTRDLTKGERLKLAAEVLGRPLTEEEEKVIWDTHEIGTKEGRRIGTFTPEDIWKKARKLRISKLFSSVERAALIEAGITGTAAEHLANLNAARPPDNPALAVEFEELRDIFSEAAGEPDVRLPSNDERNSLLDIRRRIRQQVATDPALRGQAEPLLRQINERLPTNRQEQRGDQQGQQRQGRLNNEERTTYNSMRNALEVYRGAGMSDDDIAAQGFDWELFNNLQRRAEGVAAGFRSDRDIATELRRLQGNEARVSTVPQVAHIGFEDVIEYTSRNNLLYSEVSENFQAAYKQLVDNSNETVREAYRNEELNILQELARIRSNRKLEFRRTIDPNTRQASVALVSVSLENPQDIVTIRTFTQGTGNDEQILIIAQKVVLEREQKRWVTEQLSKAAQNATDEDAWQRARREIARAQQFFIGGEIERYYNNIEKLYDAKQMFQRQGKVPGKDFERVAHHLMQLPGVAEILAKIEEREVKAKYEWNGSYLRPLSKAEQDARAREMMSNGRGIGGLQLTSIGDLRDPAQVEQYNKIVESLRADADGEYNTWKTTQGQEYLQRNIDGTNDTELKYQYRKQQIELQQSEIDATSVQVAEWIWRMSGRAAFFGSQSNKGEADQYEVSNMPRHACNKEWGTDETRELAFGTKDKNVIDATAPPGLGLLTRPDGKPAYQLHTGWYDYFTNYSIFKPTKSVKGAMTFTARLTKAISPEDQQTMDRLRARWQPTGDPNYEAQFAGNMSQEEKDALARWHVAPTMQIKIDDWRRIRSTAGVWNDWGDAQADFEKARAMNDAFKEFLGAPTRKNINEIAKKRWARDWRFREKGALDAVRLAIDYRTTYNKANDFGANWDADDIQAFLKYCRKDWLVDDRTMKLISEEKIDNVLRLPVLPGFKIGKFELFKNGKYRIGKDIDISWLPKPIKKLLVRPFALSKGYMYYRFTDFTGAFWGTARKNWFFRAFMPPK